MNATRPLTFVEAAKMWRALVREYGHRMTWVYAIQAGDDGPVKIGVSNEPNVRIATLQTANAATLKGLAAWRAFPEDERYLHEKYAAHRLQGEWFEPVEELLEEVICLGGCFVWETDPVDPHFEHPDGSPRMELPW